jgi:methyl-accepting chemotaxis protein
LLTTGQMSNRLSPGRRYVGFSFNTIRSRLYLAFALTASLTVVGSLFALFASANIGATLNQIISISMPATIESYRLAAATNGLIGSAPRLVGVKDEQSRSRIASEIAAQFDTLRKRITKLELIYPGDSEEITVAEHALGQQLNELDQAVANRIQISEQRRALTLAIRKDHEALLEAITPIIDNANFDLMTKNQMEDHNTINNSIDGLRRLLEFQADVNLLVGLMIEASLVTDTANLAPLSDSITFAKRDIDNDLHGLPVSNQRQTLADLYGRLASLAGNNGITSLRANELKGGHEAEKAYRMALGQAGRLHTAVEALIERQRIFAEDLSAHAISQIAFCRIVLIVLSLAALAVAGLIARLYVGRSIIRRLMLLSDAMRRISNGESDVPVSVSGRDEIAEMADALLVFRRAMEDVNAARRAELEQSSASETRRRKIEKATSNFEREINAIVCGLDAASQSMDECAQIMAEAAKHNKKQANSTEAASAEATRNAVDVAMAAEEIARSVEQISVEAQTSASIARHATDETKSIIEAVETLAMTVGQINGVSRLISDVAAQTNLLALNATIEAARAGPAGRGFAVVAQEVKTLASQTEKSTGEIAHQIASIETTTSNVVDAMKTIAETIMRLDGNAKEISVAVEQQDAVSKEIARSAGAAADHTREVSASMSQVSDAAAKTGELANAVLSASTELAARSGRLRAEVERFLAEVQAA